MIVNELAEIDELESVLLTDPERSVQGAYAGDLLSWVMGRAEADNAFVTIMTNVNVVAVAALAELSCVILLRFRRRWLRRQSKKESIFSEAGCQPMKPAVCWDGKAYEPLLL